MRLSSVGHCSGRDDGFGSRRFGWCRNSGAYGSRNAGSSSMSGAGSSRRVGWRPKCCARSRRRHGHSGERDAGSSAFGGPRRETCGGSRLSRGGLRGYDSGSRGSGGHGSGLNVRSSLSVGHCRHCGSSSSGLGGSGFFRGCRRREVDVHYHGQRVFLRGFSGFSPSLYFHEIGDLASWDAGYPAGDAGVPRCRFQHVVEMFFVGYRRFVIA